jgi:hypothetical protein
MEKALGVLFTEAYRRISQDAKLSLARDLADWVHELATHPFPLIGSLDLASRGKGQPQFISPSHSCSQSDSASSTRSCTSYSPHDTSNCPSFSSSPDKDKTKDDGKVVKYSNQALAPLDIGLVVGQKFFRDWCLKYCLYRGLFSNLHTFAKSLITY